MQVILKKWEAELLIFSQKFYANIRNFMVKTISIFSHDISDICMEISLQISGKNGHPSCPIFLGKYLDYFCEYIYWL